jgi:hypothetical protein
MQIAAVQKLLSDTGCSSNSVGHYNSLHPLKCRKFTCLSNLQYILLMCYSNYRSHQASHFIGWVRSWVGNWTTRSCQDSGDPDATYQINSSSGVLRIYSSKYNLVSEPRFLWWRAIIFLRQIFQLLYRTCMQLYQSAGNVTTHHLCIHLW